MKLHIKTSLGLTILAATALTANGAAIHTGLLNYWALDGTGADTAVTFAESTGVSVDNVAPAGTAGAAVINATGGLFGGAADFERDISADGRLFAADSADVDQTGESLTISLWSQFDNTSSNWQGLVVKGEGSNYRLTSNRNANVANAAYAGGTGDLNGAAIKGDQDWHHVLAITENGVSTRLWVDGVLTATSPGAPTIGDPGNVNNNELFIGNNSDNNAGSGSRMWDGMIDDVGMWDRPLTEAEIGQIFTAGSAGISLGQIPEPTTGLLIGLSGMMIMLRRRR